MFQYFNVLLFMFSMFQSMLINADDMVGEIETSDGLVTKEMQETVVMAVGDSNVVEENIEELNSLFLEKKMTTSTWQSIIFSSVTVNNYDSWLQSFVSLPPTAYRSYMQARNVHTTLYLQHYNPTSESINSNINTNINSNINTKTNSKAAGKSTSTGSGHSGSHRNGDGSSGVADANTFYEINFISDRGEQFHKYLAHAQLEGNHLHSADLRGEISLSSSVDQLYNLSYFAGWSLSHLRDPLTGIPIAADDGGAATYTYRPGDVLSVSRHRSTSFIKYCQYLSEHVIEQWTRRGLIHLMAGTMSDKLGSSVLLIAVFADTAVGEQPGRTAAEFSGWYKDLVNNQLSRLYKANSRSFALAPCVSRAYKVMASTDGVVVSNKQSRECTYRGENCVETLWTKALLLP